MITILIFALLTTGGLLFTKGMLLDSNGADFVVWGVILSAIAITMFYHGLRSIPAVPPHKGLVSIWGSRQKRVVDEGYTLLAPYFPFYYDVFLIDVEQKNQDFIIEGLRCNAQGQFNGSASVKITMSISWRPGSNGDQLYNYLNVGNEQGCIAILRDVLAEALRQSVALKSWQELAENGAEITQVVLQKIIGNNQINNTADGSPDILGLGIVIIRLNLGEIIPEGGTVVATEQATQTEIMLNIAGMLKKAYEQAGEARSLEDCMVEARRILTTQTGGANLVDAPGFAELFQRITGGRCNFSLLAGNILEIG